MLTFEPFNLVYFSILLGVYSNITDVCQPDISNLDDSNDQCVIKMDKENRNVLSILFIGQILLGIGGVPIQPFGISYIDDYASKRNSPLYIGKMNGVRG